MRQISSFLLLPVSVISFLGGAILGVNRKGMSMLPPEKQGPLGVPLLSWERFVAVMAVAPRNTVSSRGRMGAFGMDARRLADVGFMNRACKMTVGSETGVWVGEWKAPLSQEKFLENVPAQYEAFKRSMVKLAPVVNKHVGKEVEGKKASLSGLLGVGHMAGEAGVESWVKDPLVRKRFAGTTDRFHKTNGIF